MKLVRFGDVTINMHHLLAVKDGGDQMEVHFVGSSTAQRLSIRLDGEPCRAMRAWLSRCGVNDLATEQPVLRWED